MSVPLLPLFGSTNNPGPDNWVDALNQLVNYLNTNFHYNSNGGGGGGGTGTFRYVPSGVNDTITSSDFNGTVAWQSATAAGKLETLIPGVAGTPCRVTFVDVEGNAGTYNISVQASGCTVQGGSSHTGVDGDQGYITYEWDGISNWQVVG